MMKNAKRTFTLLKIKSHITLVKITKKVYDWSMIGAEKALEKGKELL